MSLSKPQKRRTILFVIVLALIILTTYLYIQANTVRELEPFEQRRETFEEVAELVLAKAHGDDRICFFPSNNDEVLLYEDEKKIIDGAQITKSGKKLLIDSNMLKDIRSFSDRAFSLIRVSDKQVVFEYYGGEFLVYDKGGRLDKGEFCDREKMDKRRTRMWNLDNGWYYLKLWVR